MHLLQLRVGICLSICGLYELGAFRFRGGVLISLLVQVPKYHFQFLGRVEPRV